MYFEKLNLYTLNILPLQQKKVFNKYTYFHFRRILAPLEILGNNTKKAVLLIYTGQRFECWVECGINNQSSKMVVQ